MGTPHSPGGMRRWKGSESSRTLARRLQSPARRSHHYANLSRERLAREFETFLAEQRARCARVAERQLDRCRERILQVQAATPKKAELLGELEVTIRGACGSDTHADNADVQSLKLLRGEA